MTRGNLRGHVPGLLVSLAVCSAAAGSALTDIEGDIAGIVERASPAVVSIRIERPAAQGIGRRFDWQHGAPGAATADERALLSELNAALEQQRLLVVSQLGIPPAHTSASGVILDADGHVLTCSTGLTGDVDITVTLADGRTSSADVVGVDSDSGVAVLKLAEELSGLPAAPAPASAATIRPGNWAIVIGNQAGTQAAVAVGNVAATGRALGALASEDFVQLAAPISPGLSGAPVFDSRGDLLGLVYAAYTPDRWAAGATDGSLGNTFSVHQAGQALTARPATPGGGPSGSVGFAIPAHAAADIAAQLISEGVVERGWLGVRINDAQGAGAVVEGILPGTPAEASDLIVGDRIVEIGGQPVNNSRALKRAIGNLKPGAKAELVVVRENNRLSIPVDLGERPQAATAQAYGALAELAAAINASRPETLGILTGAAAIPAPGVGVHEVAPDSPAERAGLEAGDAITRVNKTAVWSPDGLRAALEENADQYVLRLEIIREGKPEVLYLEVK